MNEIEYWKQVTGPKMMENMGIFKGMAAADFGCGIGNYTIPLARAVGKTGEVFAIDISQSALNRVQTAARANTLDWIETIKPRHANSLDLPEQSLDALLIYDLIHALGNSRHKLLQEFHRVLKENGILSILPFHMSRREIQNMIRNIEKHGFVLDQIVKDGGIHFEMNRYFGGPSSRLDDFEHGDIYNFRRQK